MKVIVIANPQQEQEVRKKTTSQEVQLIFTNQLPSVEELQNADGLFILNPEIERIDFTRLRNFPVIINSVVATLSELNLPANVSRISGWNTFLERETWEVSSVNEEITKKLFDLLAWKIIFVKDEPGLVAARVISRIINEAFFALAEKVSTKEEIDLALKLGTNYPFGPFEWAEKIGIKPIYTLLARLEKQNRLYEPAQALKEALNQ